MKNNLSKKNKIIDIVKKSSPSDIKDLCDQLDWLLLLILYKNCSSKTIYRADVFPCYRKLTYSPTNCDLPQIRHACMKMATNGYFVSVAFESIFTPFRMEIKDFIDIQKYYYSTQHVFIGVPSFEDEQYYNDLLKKNLHLHEDLKKILIIPFEYYFSFKTDEQSIKFLDAINKSLFKKYDLFEKMYMGYQDDEIIKCISVRPVEILEIGSKSKILLYNRGPRFCENLLSKELVEATEDLIID